MTYNWNDEKKTCRLITGLPSAYKPVCETLLNVQKLYKRCLKMGVP